MGGEGEGEKRRKAIRMTVMHASCRALISVVWLHGYTTCAPLLRAQLFNDVAARLAKIFVKSRDREREQEAERERRYQAAIDTDDRFSITTACRTDNAAAADAPLCSPVEFLYIQYAHRWMRIN